MRVSCGSQICLQKQKKTDFELKPTQGWKLMLFTESDPSVIRTDADSIKAEIE